VFDGWWHAHANSLSWKKKNHKQTQQTAKAALATPQASKRLPWRSGRRRQLRLLLSSSSCIRIHHAA